MESDFIGKARRVHRGVGETVQPTGYPMHEPAPPWAEVSRKDFQDVIPTDVHGPIGWIRNARQSG